MMARRRKPPPDPTGAVPVQLRSRLDPTWRNVEVARERFPAWCPDPETVRPWELEHRLHALTLRAWALANGYTRADYPGMLDWHRLRAAGLDG